MVFGRKGTTAANVKARPGVPDGHRHVLELLDREEADKPHQRAQMAGRILFDLSLRMMNDERGVHVDSLVAALASCGGAACLQAAFDAVKQQGKTLEDAGFYVMEGADGQTYYYEDAPNFYLWENPASLLSLALGAAQDAGGNVSAQMVEQAMGHVASTVGTPEFGVPPRRARHEHQRATRALGRSSERPLRRSVGYV
ncbi:hypothetical protein [Aurantiacibacter gangjinensis]|uniref:Uncharacterized protein n=1 Tax=Aurantiacibacter gangjinensis TaxID=502682 RepID=A0A0G9MLA2_9SPHN|nr:hypothetical protein [Aurantiacibacter gangjinensis]APE27277.1 hypothetical protein BMF35_a0448 [Aurantiacibacter gangjinensis]KLE31389.1 hypothetical protein AAW01_07240 [Aurantiacibacter gangjinensis]